MTIAVEEGHNGATPGPSPSERSFGLTIGGLFLALAGLRWLLGSGATVSAGLAAIGAVLALSGLLFPVILAGPKRYWMKLGDLMAAIVTPIVMLAIFVALFVPIGLWFRAIGRDALGRRRKPDGDGYWVARDPPGPDPATMINQF